MGHSRSTQQNTILMIVAVMGMGISFIADVYTMINFPTSYVVIGIVSVIFLVFTFLLVWSGIKLHLEKISKQEEVYEELFKSSKATYLMMRKSFGEMEDTVNNIGEIVKSPIEAFMDEQKSVSQITVNRSKENADALMNSNDKLLDKFFEFEETLENFEEQMMSKQKELMDNAIREITMKQQELNSVIKDTEIEIKKEMLSMGRPMVQPMMQPVMERPIAPTNVDDLAKEAPLMDVISDLLEESPMEEEVVIGFEEEPEISLGFDDFEEETPVIEEVIAKEPEMPNLSDPNKMMSPDDIAALLASMNVGNEETMPAAEEPQPEEVPEEMSKEPEEEKPPMPDLSDPNKMMSPEDIAALLANL